MRRLLALAIVLTTVACKEKKPPPAQAPAPAPIAVPARPQGMPAPCIEYIVAIEKLKACKATGRDALLQQFEADRDVLSGVKVTPRPELEALCVAHGPAVATFVDAHCGTTDPRSIAVLEAEVEKANTAIAAAARIASDTSAPDSARVDAKAKVGDLQKQKADLEALIHQKTCLENPLANGC